MPMIRSPIRTTVRLLAGAAALLVMGAVQAAPLPHTVTIVRNTTFELHIRIAGPAITEDNDDEVVVLNNVAGGADAVWRIEEIRLNPDDGARDDMLTVSGRAFHNSFRDVNDTHLNTGGVFSFTLDIDAEDADEQLVADAAAGVRGHSPHVDNWAAFLSARTTDAAPVNEFMDWTFTLRADHPRPRPIPEPAGLGLLALGCLGVAGMLHRRAPRGGTARAA